MGNSIHFDLGPKGEKKTFSFTKLPNKRAIHCGKMVRVHEITVVLSASGALYGSWNSCGHNISFAAHMPWTSDLAVALEKLGKITSEECAYHCAKVENERKTLHYKWKAGSVLDYADALGIKLSKFQIKRLEALQNG